MRDALGWWKAGDIFSSDTRTYKLAKLYLFMTPNTMHSLFSRVREWFRTSYLTSLASFSSSVKWAYHKTLPHRVVLRWLKWHKKCLALHVGTFSHYISICYLLNACCVPGPVQGSWGTKKIKHNQKASKMLILSSILGNFRLKMADTVPQRTLWWCHSDIRICTVTASHPFPWPALFCLAP